MARDYDLIIIGSGPGGYVAGIRAGQLGLRVAVVEKDPKPGGTCTHRGCIPTKALLHTATVLEEIRAAGTVGVEVGEPTLQVDVAQKHKQSIVDKNAAGIEFLFKKYKVTSLRGQGRIVGTGEVEVTGDDGAKRYTAETLLVATGSVPREIPVAPTDGERVLNSDHMLRLDRVPRTLAVLGAGAVGCEFASMYRSYGSEVTLVEMLPRVLPLEDEEVSAELQRAFKKRGIAVWTGTKLTGVERTDGGLSLAFEGREDRLEAEVLLVAVGRAPYTEGLGLEAIGLATERGYLRTDEHMRTAVDGVYAIGDVVTQGPWLAHKGSAEGILAVEHMAGHGGRPLDYEKVPSVVYCDPEVGSVGLTEARRASAATRSPSASSPSAPRARRASRARQPASSRSCARRSTTRSWASTSSASMPPTSSPRPASRSSSSRPPRSSSAPCTPTRRWPRR